MTTQHLSECHDASASSPCCAPFHAPTVCLNADALERASPLAKSIVSAMFRATCLAKTASVCAYAAGLPPDTTCLLFAHHQHMLDALQSSLPDAVRLDGKTPMAARQALVDKVQSGQARRAILSMGAAGVGLTMTEATCVVFCELPWNPALLQQCEDRSHRYGQTRAVEVRYLLCEGTLDGYVWDKILRKGTVLESVGI